MAKWADYLISSVKRVEGENKKKIISHALVHEDSENTFKRGILLSKDEIIKILKSDKKIRTIRWDYERKVWVVGSTITYERISGEDFLKSEPTQDKKDDIDNIIPYSS